LGTSSPTYSASCVERYLSIASELAKIPDPEVRTQVWQQVNEEAITENIPVTAKFIQQVANDEVRYNHRAQGTGDNEWYTPTVYVEAARQVLGEIELDPASSEIAQRVVQAVDYFTIDLDGLKQPWFGKVWLNPPYAQPAISM